MKILTDIVDHWKADWYANQPLFWLEFLGTLLSITSTATLSTHILHPPMMFCYVTWLLGSTMIMLGAHMRGASWMFTLMLFNTVMNIVGLGTLVLG